MKNIRQTLKVYLFVMLGKFDSKIGMQGALPLHSKYDFH